MKKFKTLLQLFFNFLKIGLFTFGGGYAMLVLIEHELVEKKKWIERDDYYDMLAIAESTPGPIAINSATFIGYRLLGVLGSITATIAVCIPSVVIIFSISLFLDAFLEITLVAYAFKGIQACVAFLILNAGVKMIKKLKKNPLSIALLSIVTVAYIILSLFAVKFSSIFYILIGAGAGVIAYLISSALQKAKNDKGGDK